MDYKDYDLYKKYDFKTDYKKEIINNNEIINNKEILKYNKEKEYYNKEIILNNLNKATSFNAMVQALSQARQQLQRPSQPTQTVQTQQMQPKQPIQQQPSTPTPSQPVQTAPQQSTPQGTTYDTDKMWSPQSFAGNIYEWNRGVISIAKDGNYEKENLDNDIYAHHGGATIRTLNALGIEIENPYADSEPFKVGVDGSDLGIVVFQSEGDTVFLYLPVSPTMNQIESLKDVLLPRQDFSISIMHNGEMFDEQTVASTIDFCLNLNDLSNGNVKTA